MLTNDEIRWLNDYHESVYIILSPHLDKGEKQWLRKVTQPLTTK
jgi:Xaa-Pro aminopeptidase